jgi:putative spermidine/putrescine transport system substrate-binding protein
MVEQMRRGGIDLVTASGDASLRLIYTRVVQPIDLKRVPSFTRLVDRRLQQADWHYVNGRHYGVPYLWGPNVLIYDRRVFRQAPPDWRTLFERAILPDGRTNAGRMQAWDTTMRVADAALYLMQRRPELGIRDPYELDDKQYAAVLEAARVGQSLLGANWDSEAGLMESFRHGKVVLASAWPYPALALQREGVPVDYVVPKEGTTGWADTTLLHYAAAHPECAYRWLEWSIQPDVQAAVAAFTGTVPAVPAACGSGTQLGAKGCAGNGAAAFDRIHFWKTPTVRCASHGTCVGYARWQQDYKAIIKGSR